jgi:S1-C subfamily serine protease
MAFTLLIPVLAALTTQHAAPLVQETPRAWIGVSLSETEERGLEITSVEPDSPASRAGIEAGDRLLAAGGRRLTSFDALLEELSGRAPGSKLEVAVARQFDVGLDGERTADGGRPLLGVDLGGESPTRIAGVNRGYPARQAGLRAGDQLLSIGNESMDSVEDVIAAMSTFDEGDTVTVGIRRGLVVTLGRRPGALAREPRVEIQELPLIEVPEVQLRGRVEAGQLPRARLVTPPSADLHGELRELASDLRELRREIAELRRELESLRRGQGER